MSSNSESPSSNIAEPPSADGPVFGIRHPAWLLAAITVPQALLLFFLGRDYQILRTEIAAEYLAQWHLYLGVLAVLCSGFTAYGIWCLVRSRPLKGAWLSPVALVLYIACLYAFIANGGYLYSNAVPAWIASSENGLIYVLTFLSPGLLYALILGVFELTPEKDESARRILLNFAGVVLLPIGSYLALMLIMNVRVAGASQVQEFLFPIFLIAATVAFFFLLIRAVLLLGRGRLGEAMSAPGVQIPFRLVIGVVFPLLGLVLNNHGELIGLREMTHVFGDFDHPGFYIFALLNGVALALPDREEPLYRTGLFLARLFLFPFSLYFCFVFLPYLPLALLAMFLFGLGFLMLTPLVLTIVHIRALLGDYAYLQNLPGSLLPFRARTALLSGLAALLLWPLLISASYLYERRILHTALDYAYQPDPARNKAGINPRALRKVLLEIRRYKSSAGTPYLGLYYQWLVLDNLTVSDAKLDSLQLLFFGETEEPPVPSGLWGTRTRNGGRMGGGMRPPSTLGRLEGAVSRTRYDPQAGVYRSTVDLSLLYPAGADLEFGGSDAQTEYQTRFRLPSGARITEYYLDIAGKREYGMLAEKKSALWIYNQITSFRQDPGLLYYADPETLVLRVFPILKGQRRTTGFEIAHIEPFDLEVDGRRLRLSAPGPRPDLIAFREGVYVSAAAKAKAGPGNRRPQIHFVMDCAARSASAQTAVESEGANDGASAGVSIKAEDEFYVQAILDVTAGGRVPDAREEIVLVCANYEYATRSIRQPDRAALVSAATELRREIPRRGQFAPGRAMRGLLARFPREDRAADSFPVFILLPDPEAEPGEVFGSDLRDLRDLRDLAWVAPEMTAYYVLQLSGFRDRTDSVPDALGLYLYGSAFGGGFTGPLERLEFAPTIRIAPETLNAAAQKTSWPTVQAAGRGNHVAPLFVRQDGRATILPVTGIPLDPARSALVRARPATSGNSAGAAQAEQSNERHASRSTAAMLLAAAAIERNHLLYPAEAAAQYLAMVRAAFGAHMLLQSTSFLSVETEAQKLALKRKQDQVLRGHSALDAGEEPVRLDEPGFFLLALLLFAAALWRARRVWLRRVIESVDLRS